MLQFQLFTLPPTLVNQIMWGRFVNSKGGIGRNIPCNLFNEHVNRIFKEAVGNMGSNFTEHSTTRVARSVTLLEKHIGWMNNVLSLRRQLPCTMSSDHDIRQVVKVVCRQQSLKVIPGRYHSHFKKMSSNPLASLDWSKIKKWVKSKALQYEK